MRNDGGNPTEYDPYGYPDPAVPQTGQPVPGAPYAPPVYPLVPEIRSKKGIVRLVIFLAIVSAALIVLQAIIFRLQTVYVIGSHAISAEYIVSLTGLERGDSIIAVSEDQVRDKLDADHWIVLKHLYKQYPSEIYLVVDEREIVATMQYLGIQYTLDLEGMVLEEYSDIDYEGGVPVVYGFKVSNAIVGSYLAVNSDAQLIAYSSIISELTIQKAADQIVSINVADPEQLSLLTVNGITVQLGNSDYMRAKIGAMRTDLAYIRQLGYPKGVLDVSVPEDGKFRRE